MMQEELLPGHGPLLHLPGPGFAGDQAAQQVRVRGSTSARLTHRSLSPMCSVPKLGRWKLCLQASRIPGAKLGLGYQIVLDGRYGDFDEANRVGSDLKSRGFSVRVADTQRGGLGFRGWLFLT
jgi:hypothetical protein